MSLDFSFNNYYKEKIEPEFYTKQDHASCHLVHFIDIQQNVILVFCIWAKIWEFGHTIHFDIILEHGRRVGSAEPTRTVLTMGSLGRF